MVDAATPPEKKSKPKRAVIAGSTTLVVGLLLAVWIVFRQSLRDRNRPAGASPAAT